MRPPWVFRLCPLDMVIPIITNPCENWPLVVRLPDRVQKFFEHLSEMSFPPDHAAPSLARDRDIQVNSFIRHPAFNMNAIQRIVRPDHPTAQALGNIGIESFYPVRFCFP